MCRVRSNCQPLVIFRDYFSPVLFLAFKKPAIIPTIFFTFRRKKNLRT